MSGAAAAPAARAARLGLPAVVTGFIRDHIRTIEFARPFAQGPAVPETFPAVAIPCGGRASEHNDVAVLLEELFA